MWVSTVYINDINITVKDKIYYFIKDEYVKGNS